MILIIREYLASLRERGELDAVLPSLLTQMGFTVYSRPAVGTRQYGVDVAAVGRGEDGVRRVHLFTVKSGDLTRQEWNSPSPQSVRPSLDEIRDHYIATRIPPEYAELPIAICICFGGDLDQQVNAQVVGYFQNNETDKVKYELWNGDRLAQAILDGIFREELLPPALRSHLRKAVALVDEPDAAFAHFDKLIDELTSISGQSPSHRIATAQLINICLWILFVWAREAGNVEAAYRASELALVRSWGFLNHVLVKSGRTAQNASLVIFELTGLHLTIWDELYRKKVLPYAQVRHGIESAVPSHFPIDVNLRLFETLGRIALRGLWLVWEASGESPLPSILDDGATVQRVDEICQGVIALIANNKVLLSPATDEQAIDIAVALTLLASRRAFHSVINNWLTELANNTAFAYRVHGRYPTTARSYWDLVEHPAEKTDEYRRSVTEGSVLYPLLAIWATVMGNDAALTTIAEFKAEQLAHTNFQFWLPDEDTESLLYDNARNHGAVLTGIPVVAGTNDTLDYISREVADNPHFGALSMISLGHWPILLTACRLYRLPIPPQVWNDLFPALQASREPPDLRNEILPEQAEPVLYSDVGLQHGASFLALARGSTQ